MDRFADRACANRLGFRVALIAALMIVASAISSAAQDPCAPSRLVRISDSTTITASEINDFDAIWMSDACRQDAHGKAWAALAYLTPFQSWGPAERMAVLAHMYELTHQQRYLAELHDLIELALSYRDDRFPGYPGYPSDPAIAGCPPTRCGPAPVDELRGTGPLPAWGGFGPGTGEKNTIDVDASSLYSYPIAAFARIVAENPSLQAAYGGDAIKYANAAMETVWVIMPQVKYRPAGNYWWGYVTSVDVREMPLGCRSSDPGCTPAKLTNEDCTRAFDQESKGVTDNDALNRLKQIEKNCENLIRGGADTIAHNENGLFMMMLIELWRALDSDFYRQSPNQPTNAEPTRVLIPLLVSRYQRFLADHLRSDSDPRGTRFYWNYQDLTVLGTHPEDTGHGAYDMLYLDALRRNLDRLNTKAAPLGEPIALDDTYSRRFANTLLQKIAIGTNFAFDVTGAGASGSSWKTSEDVNKTCNGWANLAIADSSVYRICKEISLRVVEGAQRFLTIGNHLALLRNKEYQHVIDRSSLYGTPDAAAPTTACVISGLGVHDIAYRDNSGHLHELWRDAKEGTGTTDLTKVAAGGAPGAVGTPYFYVDTIHNVLILLYRDNEGTVGSLYWSTGAVGHDNLSGTAGAPSAAGDPVGYYVPAADTHHVIYRTGDGNLHELDWRGATPVKYGGNLTGAISAPHAAGDPTAFANNAGYNIVAYRSSVNGEILGLYWSQGPSGLDRLSVVAGTPPASGDPFGYYTGYNNTHQIVYQGADGHLYELYWAGNDPVRGWDITPVDAPPPTGNLAAYYSAGTNTKHVFYRSVDGHLHEIWWVPGGGMPAHVDLTNRFGAPLAADRPAAFTIEGPNTQHVTYRGTDNHIYEIIW